MKKYFVIGNPINHSLSPKLHNYWLEQNNINAVYEKIKLEENEIENFIHKIKNQEINGCNVTVPFKKTVIPFLDKLSLEAEQAQSVNTICFNNGDLVGHNTDIIGFQKAINSLNYEIKDKKILILTPRPRAVGRQTRAVNILQRASAEASRAAVRIY